jgi:hypothetical protein
MLAPSALWIQGGDKMTSTGLRNSLTALILLAGIPLFAEGATVPPKGISAHDLENGTNIIGVLGLPLGELASIKARIVGSDSKAADQYIEVFEIGKSKLSKPIQFIFDVWQWGNLSNKSLPINQELSLRVYETGGMVGVPEAAMKETTYVTTVGWAFRTSLVILYEEK